MLQNPKHNLSVLRMDHTLSDVYEALDQLHSAVTDGSLNQVSKLNKRELESLLRDLIYTAQETIEEIGKSDMWQEPTMLRIVEKTGASQRGA